MYNVLSNNSDDVSLKKQSLVMVWEGLQVTDASNGGRENV